MVVESILELLKDWVIIRGFGSKALSILITVVLAAIAVKTTNSLVNRLFDEEKPSKINMDPHRMSTIRGLLKNLLKYIIYFIAFTSIARLFIDITGLIATAGVGGLAIGFGAQNLVRDVITGFFILIEEQYNVGAFVQVDGISGIVEDMTLRVTKIRDFNGDLHIVPNGEVKKVTNKSNGKMRALVEMSIAYEEDIDRAIEVLTQASEKLQAENQSILEGPTVLGVSRLDDSDVVISVMAKTVPMEQWSTERLMLKTFKQAFDKEGIEIPYPRRVIINQSE
ncbi:mechanosensitive ion channel family protein [Serpentinicella sp. ANB-PHB4]|nr:mechanosensitive ion channel family protein [Serpentinicella sp. ANB-PHB4]MDR5659096.1 mechanosensitive ion channel family protein [Serpentinicella sp. ANB-PHB4]